MKQHNDLLVSELIQSERVKLSGRARSVASNSIIVILIFGAIVTFILSFTVVGWKAGLVNIPFVLFMIFYYHFQSKYTNEVLAWCCIILGILYFVFMFSMFYVLMFNMIRYGTEVSVVRFHPALLHICIVCIVSLFIGPFYVNQIIKKKTYRKNSKTNKAIIVSSAVLGITIGKIFIGNILLVIINLGIFFTISMLILTLYYYIFVIKNILYLNMIQ